MKSLLNLSHYALHQACMKESQYQSWILIQENKKIEKIKFSYETDEQVVNYLLVR